MLQDVQYTVYHTPPRWFEANILIMWTVVWAHLRSLKAKETQFLWHVWTSFKAKVILPVLHGTVTSKLPSCYIMLTSLQQCFICSGAYTQGYVYSLSLKVSPQSLRSLVLPPRVSDVFISMLSALRGTRFLSFRARRRIGNVNFTGHQSFVLTGWKIESYLSSSWPQKGLLCSRWK